MEVKVHLVGGQYCNLQGVKSRVVHFTVEALKESCIETSPRILEPSKDTVPGMKPSTLNQTVDRLGRLGSEFATSISSLHGAALRGHMLTSRRWTGTRSRFPIIYRSKEWSHQPLMQHAITFLALSLSGASTVQSTVRNQIHPTRVGEDKGAILYGPACILWNQHKGYIYQFIGEPKMRKPWL